MDELLGTIGRTFLKTFASSIIVFAPGILAAPDLNTTKTLAIAGLLASLAAAIKGVQAYVPQLTVRRWIEDPYGQLADSFLHGFLASIVVTSIGVLHAADLSTAKGLITAGIIGAVNAGLRAVQGALTPGEAPLKAKGVPAPPAPAAKP